METDYLRVATMLNQDYRRVEALNQEITDKETDFVEVAQPILQTQKITTEEIFTPTSETNVTSSLIRVAIDLTQSTENSKINKSENSRSKFGILELGEYQLWRDQNEIAVIDVSNQKLVVYAEIDNNGSAFLPIQTFQGELFSQNNYSPLVHEISQIYHNLRAEFDDNSVDKAYNFVKLNSSFSNLEKSKTQQIAQTLYTYLQSINVNEIEKPDFFLAYQPETKTIKYQDKQDRNNAFQAELISGNWHNVEVEGNLSLQKLKQIQQAIRMLERQSQPQESKSRNKRLKKL